MSAREKTESPAKTARRTTAPESAAITFEGLQSRGEKLAEWIGANPAPILGTLAAVLVVAAVIGFVESSRNEASQEAALALATVQTDYRAAMGAQPGDTAVPEPANPETARRVRTDYAERFAKVAVEYAGTPVGAMASLERGALQQELGDAAGAIATWDEAARRATGAIRGILLTRVGEARESAHDPAGAAESYEQ
ncbi:MAG: hypothetical protein KC560_08100, partial [Myxococcales bacterium]|nr:hypothetical protein [Myxococcales bacterium]